MKIRLDFVTNSSSSSFIIGHADDENLTVESVYSLIRSFYKEYLDILIQARDYLEHTGRFAFDREGKLELIYPHAKVYAEPYKSIRENLKKKFANIDIWDDFRLSIYNWVDSCKTYEDYLRKTDGVPFKITDFSTKDFNYSPWDEHEAVSWYCDCADDLFVGKETDCSSCDWKDYCSFDKKTLADFKEKLASSTVSPEQTMAMFLGKYVYILTKG